LCASCKDAIKIGILKGGEKLETVKIYLSGAMGSVSFEEQSKWRRQIIESIKFGDYNYVEGRHKNNSFWLSRL
jgi:hypothetical protein